MSLSSELNRNDYVGNNNVDTYDYGFKIFDETHLRVVVRHPTTGVETDLVHSTDYTVTGVNSSTGGTIVLVNASQAWLTAGKLTSAWALAILRNVPITQITDIRNQGDFFPEVHEDEFDKLTMQDQQQQDEIDRSLKMASSISPLTFDPTLPSELAVNPGATVVVNPAGTGFDVGPTAADVLNAQNVADSAATASAASAAAAVVSASAASTSAGAASTSATASATSASASATSASSAATTLANVIQKTFMVAIGDLITASAVGVPAILSLGSQGQVLTVDTAQPLKIKWSSAAIGLASQGVAALSLPKTTAAADDGKVFLMTGTGTITLHAATSGFKFTLIDKSGTLSTLPVTLVPNAAQKIQGINANYVLEADYGAWEFYFDGTDWYFS